MAGTTSRATRASASTSSVGEVLQFKVWLMGVSPMIWRRLQVSPTMTLRELHGTLQVAMGWEGLHLYQFVLRGKRHGSWQLSAASPDVTLDELCLRRRARFVYEYDLNVPWRHELRLEDRVACEPRRSYPFCAGGHAPCPPEEVGGPAGYQARREAWLSCEAMEDLADLAEILRAVVLEGQHERLDEETAEAMRDILERMRVREEWKGVPFSRKAVNARLRAGEHLALMHQQY